jgi:hypothetical protein
MTLYMGIGSATFICVNRGVILIYFTVKEGIEPFETKIEVSNWLKLSEKWCARARVQLAAAGGIAALPFLACRSACVMLRCKEVPLVTSSSVIILPRPPFAQTLITIVKGVLRVASFF